MTPPEPMNEQASPMRPVSEQYFALAPLPVVGHDIFDGHTLLMRSQFTWQPHDVAQLMSLQADAVP